MGPGAAASPAGSDGGEAGPSAAGSRLLSVEIRSTMLERQSRLETTELLSLFRPPAHKTDDGVNKIYLYKNGSFFICLFYVIKIFECWGTKCDKK